MALVVDIWCICASHDIISLIKVTIFEFLIRTTMQKIFCVCIKNRRNSTKRDDSVCALWGCHPWLLKNVYWACLIHNLMMITFVHYKSFEVVKKCSGQPSRLWNITHELSKVYSQGSVSFGKSFRIVYPDELCSPSRI